ncbi:unnamed protein product, partial [Candidula unifasciata]
HLDIAIREFNPHLVVYNAGTDILEYDPLGSLCITPKGVMERDRLVFEKCKLLRIPIFMLTSGGYLPESAKVVSDSILNLWRQGLISHEVSAENQGEVRNIITSIFFFPEHNSSYAFFAFLIFCITQQLNAPKLCIYMLPNSFIYIYILYNSLHIGMLYNSVHVNMLYNSIHVNLLHNPVHFNMFCSSVHVNLFNNPMHVNMLCNSVHVNLFNSPVHVNLFNSPVHVNLFNSPVCVNLFNSPVCVNLFNSPVHVNLFNNPVCVNLFNSPVHVNLFNNPVNVNLFNSPVHVNLFNSSVHVNLFNSRVHVNLFNSPVHVNMLDNYVQCFLSSCSFQSFIPYCFYIILHILCCAYF